MKLLLTKPTTSFQRIYFPQVLEKYLWANSVSTGLKPLVAYHIYGTYNDCYDFYDLLVQSSDKHLKETKDNLNNFFEAQRWKYKIEDLSDYRLRIWLYTENTT